MNEYQVLPNVVVGTRRRRTLQLVAAAAVGALVASAIHRRRLMALAAAARPYIRRRARVTDPALIVNRWSGGGKAERYGLVDAAEALGIRVILLERGDDITQLARDAIAAGADAIGAAGGDGSLGLVAGVAVEHDVPFFCVPVGTRNHFALDLGLDRDDPLSALEALRHGDELRIDYGLAGDRPFLNNVSFGVYAEAVHRPEYRDNKEHTLASVLRHIGGEHDTRAALRFETPEGEHAERTSMTLVSNNPYVWSGPPDHGRRTRLDQGEMGITAAAEGTSADGVVGHGIRHWTADRFRIESDEPVKAGLDGEALVFESPLELTTQPKGLRVLVPSGTRPGYVPKHGLIAAELSGLAHLAGVPGRTDDRPEANAVDA